MRCSTESTWNEVNHGKVECACIECIPSEAAHAESIFLDSAFVFSLPEALVVSTPATTATSQEELQALVAQLHAELAAKNTELSAKNAALKAAKSELTQVISERDKLRRAYNQLLEQMALLRRRIFVAKAERVDPHQLELELEETQKKLDALAAALEEPAHDENAAAEQLSNSDAAELGGRPAGKPPAAPRAKPKGRRNLANAHIPERRIEILDPTLEGQAERVGWETSYKLGYQRPGPIRVAIARAKYKVADAESGDATIQTAPRPRSLLSRSLLAPSILAQIIVAKFRFGMPYFRQEQALAAAGIELDRGTMARAVEDTGASLGPIVLACAADARNNAFCLSTDATGVSIRPEPIIDRRRQPCRKGHFFVVLADKRHIFFEYQPKHTSAAVCEMFRGFSGYVQADAHTVYDALFRGEAVDDDNAPVEVACWAHARRRFWEAAVSGYPVGRAGLLRIRKLYELDFVWSELPPAARLVKRQTVLKPLVDEFFAWVGAEAALIVGERGLVNKALGYALRQQTALSRFLEDGRLRMDNNLSEGALRSIATGRKAWLFFGSDDHANAAANLFSLIASCKLHDLDPERYLADVIHVMPYWPRERYLELAPAFWAHTRARLSPSELAAEVGHITVPPPSDSTEQPPPE
jgi:transposase